MPPTLEWRSSVRRFPWFQIGLFVGVMLVYLHTLAPGVLGGDPGEYQFVPYILSMPHPTGTPLYILLSKLWSMLPLGPSVAWRLNLLGAISASLAVVMVYQCVHLLVERRVPALAAALAFAFGTTFWEQATMADKYAFNAFMVGLLLYLTLRWGRTRSPATLNLLALQYGLSLAHHRTMVLFAPALLGYVWWHERSALWRDRRRLLRLSVLLLAPLLLYLYLPWALARDLPPGTWHPQTLGDWIWTMYDEGWIREIRVVPEQQDQTYCCTARHAARLHLGGLLLGSWVWHGSSGVTGLMPYSCSSSFSPRGSWPPTTMYRGAGCSSSPPFVFSLWVGEGLGWIWIGRAVAAQVGEGGRALARGSPDHAGPAPVPLFQTYRPSREAHLGAGVLDVWRQELKWGTMASAWAGPLPVSTRRSHCHRLGAGHSPVVLSAGRRLASRR